MNRITLFLLTFAIFINVLLIIVEVTLEATLHLCPNAFNDNGSPTAQRLFSLGFTMDMIRRGCYSSATT